MENKLIKEESTDFVLGLSYKIKPRQREVLFVNPIKYVWNVEK